MTKRLQCSVPVSPFLSLHKGTSGQPAVEPRDVVDDEQVRAEHMVFKDPIVGKAPPDEYSTVIRGLTTPKEMTVEQYQHHCLTHIPYDPACAYCGAAKRANVAHLPSPSGRRIPLLVADYGFLAMKATQEVVPYRCIHVRPWRLTFATCVDAKGPDPIVAKRLAQIVQDLGLTHFAYRSDREAAIRSMLSSVVKLAGVKAHLLAPEDPDDESSPPAMTCTNAPAASSMDVPAAAPEESHVGESRSNGLAERAIQSVTSQVRCMKLALEDRIHQTIPSHHPILTWMVEYASMLISKYQPGEDGMTPYQRLHGQPIRERLPEFGETVLWFVPARLGSSLGPKWRFGVFLGRGWRSDQNFIGLVDGTMTRAKGIARTVESKRWQTDRLAEIRATPWQDNPKLQDQAEEAFAPPPLKPAFPYKKKSLTTTRRPQSG